MKHFDITARTSSGTGAAHIWGPFGRRGPLLDEQDRGGGGGTGGDPGGTPPPEPTPEKKHSDADVERIVQERLARDRRDRSAQPPSPKPGKAGTSKAAKTTDDSTSTSATWVFDFTDALDAVSEETGWKPSRGLKARMRSAFEAEKPDDPDAWVQSWADDAGHKKPDPTQTPNSQQAKDGEKPNVASKPPTGPTNSDKGGAGGAPIDFEAKLNDSPLELTKLDIQRLVEKHGTEEKAFEVIRDAVNRKLKTMKLVADPRRKA